MYLLPNVRTIQGKSSINFISILPTRNKFYNFISILHMLLKWLHQKNPSDWTHHQVAKHMPEQNQEKTTNITFSELWNPWTSERMTKIFKPFPISSKFWHWAVNIINSHVASYQVEKSKGELFPFLGSLSEETVICHI